jgi:hypothetical protein
MPLMNDTTAPLKPYMANLDFSRAPQRGLIKNKGENSGATAQAAKKEAADRMAEAVAAIIRPKEDMAASFAA